MHAPTKAVPTSIDQDELIAALRPLCALLNVTANHFFDIPGLQIGFGRITFVVGSPKTKEEWGRDRPPGRAAELDLQGQGTAELAQVVTVRITRPDALTGEPVNVHE